MQLNRLNGAYVNGKCCVKFATVTPFPNNKPKSK